MDVSINTDTLQITPEILSLIDTLPELSLQIPELAKEHGRLTISQIVQITGANRNTVKKHLQALVAARHLVQHRTGKGTWYARG